MRVERHLPTKTVLFRFEGCADFADTTEARGIRSIHSGGQWVNGETWEQTVERARRGNTDLVAQAEELVNKLTVEAQREKAVWIPSMAGAFPIVADYMTGRPDCMRRRFPEPNERAPIKIFVELTSSGGILAQDMVKRGTAILALALLLNMERSVDLNVIVGLDASTDGNQASFCVIPLGTSPLDIALACNALTSVGFTRGMGYSFLQQSPESRSYGGWEWGLHPDSDANRAEYIRRLRAALDASTDDIIVPPVHLHDPVMRDPLGFVQRALADALKVERDAG